MSAFSSIEHCLNDTRKIPLGIFNRLCLWKSILQDFINSRFFGYFSSFSSLITFTSRNCLKSCRSIVKKNGLVRTLIPITKSTKFKKSSDYYVVLVSTELSKYFTNSNKWHLRFLQGVTIFTMSVDIFGHVCHYADSLSYGNLELSWNSMWKQKDKF